jgi:hypothetical protein
VGKSGCKTIGARFSATNLYFQGLFSARLGADQIFFQVVFFLLSYLHGSPKLNFGFLLYSLAFYSAFMVDYSNDDLYLFFLMERN